MKNNERFNSITKYLHLDDHLPRAQSPQGNTKERYKPSKWTVEFAVHEIEFQDQQLVDRGLRIIQLERQLSNLTTQYEELAKKHCIK